MSAKYKMILASQSPRRKELLGHLGIPFFIQPSHVEEVSEATNPIDYSLDIALLKGRDIALQNKSSPESIIVSADTIVVHKKIIYGKPQSPEDAHRMLSILSGETHSVYTSVVLIGLGKEKTFSVESRVTFSKIAKSIMDHYLTTKDSLDKAGAYGIQGNALTFIENLEGSYSNVVGFPLSHFIKELKTFLNLDLENSDWRNLFS
jgi:septum formation protein